MLISIFSQFLTLFICNLIHRYAEQQAEAEAQAAAETTNVVYLVPSQLMIETEAVGSSESEPFATQPEVKVLDSSVSLNMYLWFLDVHFLYVPMFPPYPLPPRGWKICMQKLERIDYFVYIYPGFGIQIILKKSL